MLQIRRNVFETNSSSTHSITICSQKELDAWHKGELYLSRYSDKFITPEQFEAEFAAWVKKYRSSYTEEEINRDRKGFIEDFCECEGYLTAEQYDLMVEYYEEFSTSYTTESGEEIIAFGYFGYDG